MDDVHTLTVRCCCMADGNQYPFEPEVIPNVTVASDSAQSWAGDLLLIAVTDGHFAKDGAHTTKKQTEWGKGRIRRMQRDAAKALRVAVHQIGCRGLDVHACVRARCCGL
eukprot:365209-Chlamydomonas_euryale.AAC.8